MRKLLQAAPANRQPPLSRMAHKSDYTYFIAVQYILLNLIARNDAKLAVGRLAGEAE